MTKINIIKFKIKSIQMILLFNMFEFLEITANKILFNKFTL